MANKQSAANQVVRALLTLIGERRDFDVLGILPSHLQGKKIRQRLLEEFDNKCAYCGTAISTTNSDIDHITPMNKAAVGLHMLGNLVPTCKPCNAFKHSSNLMEFADKHPERLSPNTVAKLTARAVEYGANLNTEPLRRLVAELYLSIGELVEAKQHEAARILPNPTVKVRDMARKVQSKAEYDFSIVARQFPLGSLVRAIKDGLVGVVVDYSLEGAQGKKMPYVRFHVADRPRPITRSPNQLELIANARG